MNLFDRIASVFRRTRNKPGGMSWVRGIGPGTGAEQLNGRAVKTVRIDAESGLWLIEPPQPFICTYTCRFGVSQRLVLEGQIVTVTCIADELLEPWKEDGVTDADVRELFAPDVRVTQPKIKEPVHG